jgi:UDP-N-acetylglucosamine 2-epimerase (non-hydrolysing)
MIIHILIGTRPNFIKVTRFKEVAMTYPNIDIKIIHTGQHYDEKMADVFFRQFNLEPDYYLNIPQVSANKQIAEIMIRLEDLMSQIGKPDILLVPGDVNSTLAGALTANKLGIKLGHIEAGLRSFDNSMPEEHNRVLTDKLSDYYFVTEQSGLDILKKEGVEGKRIAFSGNTMIDTLVKFSKEIESSTILSDLQIENTKYILMTMHRPATVDDKVGLQKLTQLINDVSINYKVVFPIHPRTLKRLEEFDMKTNFLANKNLILTEPLDYFSFQKLIKYTQFILTDSGGIQEESTFVGKPCLTLRPNTERPITITEGTNTLVTFDIELIKSYIAQIETGNYKKGKIPKAWDGKSTERILEFIMKEL